MSGRKYRRRMPEDTQLSCPTCGYTTRMTTAGQAARSLRLHSCTRWQEVAAAAVRKAKRRQRSGPTRECRHPQARHVHGTSQAYDLDKCRCRPCTDAAAAAERTRARQIAYGRWQPYVDAQPAREHVQRLQAAGIGLRTIAVRADVSGGAIQRLIYGRDGRGPSRRIRAETSEAILAVTAVPAPGARVSGVGTRRRLRALSALGWSRTLLASHLGVTCAVLSLLILGDERTVLASTARAVRDVYDRLWDTAPPDTTRKEREARTRTLKDAHTRGWTLPQTWDDETIDDPAATPAGNVEPSLESRHRAAVVDAAIELAGYGESIDAVAGRIGMKVATLEQILRRAGRADVVRALRTDADARLTSRLVAAS